MVVVAKVHRNALPVFFFRKLPQKLTSNRVMPICKDVSLDHYLVADGALDRVAAAVDLGPHRFDDDARGRRADFVARFIQA
jgi:hypothetical protein